MKKRKLAIIGASDLQLPLIEKAKAMDLETHVFAWAAGDVGETAADYFYPISIVDTDEIIRECEKIRPDGVATIASDLAAITVIKVATALGLPCNPIETATIATNKYAMRQTFRDAGIPTPQFTKVSPNDIPEQINSFCFPIIVKPTDRSGSRGIYKLETKESLHEAIKEACEQSFEKKAIIEEYIEGKEYSCECITQNGVHHMLAITKKFTTGAPHFIETGHMEPSGLSTDTSEKVKEQVYKALDALHVRTGASHSEFKVDPKTGEIRLIEIGARMGGDCIGSDLVYLSAGYDFVQMTIQCALGEPISLRKDPSHPVAAIRFIMNEDDYKHYESMNETAKACIIRTSNIHKPKRSMALDSSTRSGFFIVTGNTAEEVLTVAYLHD